MLNVFLLNFYMASSTTNFILFLVCTAIQNISWMDRFINAYVIIIIIEQPYQIWMQFKQQFIFISYRAHKLFRRSSFFNPFRPEFTIVISSTAILAL